MGKWREIMSDLTLGGLFVVGSIVLLLTPGPAGGHLVDPARAPLHGQSLIRGLAFMGLGFLGGGMLARAAGAAGDFLRRNRRFLRFQRWFAGTSFIGLGVTAAMATRK